MGLTLLLDAEQNTELRAGLELREEQLKKVRKATEDAGCSIHDIARRLEVVDTLKAHTEEQLDIENEPKRNGKRRPDEEGQMTVDEALVGAEKEAAQRIRTRRMRDVLVAIAPAVTDRVAFSKLSDEEIARAIAARWDAIEYQDADAQEKKDRVWPGLYKHEFDDADGKGVLWCAVEAKEITDRDSVGFPVRLRFWYDIQVPDLFVPDSLMATLLAQEVVALYRELLAPTPAEVIDALLASKQQKEIDGAVTQRALAVLKDLLPNGVQSPIGDGDLESAISFAFDEAELPAVEGFFDFYMVASHDPAQAAVIYLRTGVVPGFFYGIDFDNEHTLEEDLATALVAIEGEQLLKVARLMLGLEKPEEKPADDGKKGPEIFQGDSENIPEDEKPKGRKRSARKRRQRGEESTTQADEDADEPAGVGGG